MKNFFNQTVLITGGTGSIGQSLTRFLLNKTKVKKVIIFSRDELKQYDMRQFFKNDHRLRFFLGDIRDAGRLELALNNVDYVIHAAALKQVPAGEYNPLEFIKTNVYGSQCVIEACTYRKVKKIIALSTDKASSPINLYGATKLTADKLFVASNSYSLTGNKGSAFSVVRYGNVMGSRGSVISLFKKLAQEKKDLPVTDITMTRFWISIEGATKFICDSFYSMRGGELFVPRIPSMKIVDLATAISPASKIIEVGIRPGEKLHEEMISAEDSRRAVLCGDRYVVNPVHSEWGYKPPRGKKLQENWSYRSDTNDLWISIAQMKKFIKYMG